VKPSASEEKTAESWPHSRKLGRWLQPRILPGLLLAIGLGIAVFLGYRSQQKTPPTASEAAFLILATFLLNVAAAGLFSRIGKAEPKHARSAVRRLISIGRAVVLAREALSDGVTSGNAQELRNKVWFAEGLLEPAEQDLLDAIEDWNDIHREALREVRREIQEGGS
jgi:hypothetical protein